MSTGAWRQSLQCCTTRENMGLQQLPLGHPWPSQSQKGRHAFFQHQRWLGSTWTASFPSPELVWMEPGGG